VRKLRTPHALRATVVALALAVVCLLVVTPGSAVALPAIPPASGSANPEPSVAPTEDESRPTEPATTEPEPPATQSPESPPTGQQSPAPTGQQSAPPNVQPAPPASPTAQATGSGELERIPPASTQPSSSPVSWVLAALALLVGVITGFVLRRRERRSPAPAAPAVPPVPADDDAAVRLAALEAVGEAMIDAGFSVAAVRQALEEIAAANGYPGTEVVAFPTALFVSARGLGEVRTGVVSSGGRDLLLAQTDALDEVIFEARAKAMDADEIVRRIAEIRAMPEPYTLGQRVLAYALASAGIAVLLGASWGGTGVAAILGALVGWAQIQSDRLQQLYRPLVTVGCAFVVSTVVLTLVGAGLDPGVLPSVIAPLVIFLPGGLITTGVVELATGHMMAGAGRVAAGAMQLVLLAFGVVAGSLLVGVPRLELVASSQPIGPIGPWLAVAAFGVGIVIHQCGRARSIGWILLVLYVAYGAQVLGDFLFGGVLSAFVGALAMTPVAALVARQPSGPAAFVSFLPAFWLLVPGSLGLVGVAVILDGGSGGLNTLVTTASTMVAIALGALAGAAMSSRLSPEHRSLI
jgi:uncharacterized membrane protein YjjP (DUF1212 family)/uncharacterized membrane protein YjjB (DUF3815 family)